MLHKFLLDCKQFLNGIAIIFLLLFLAMLQGMAQSNTIVEKIANSKNDDDKLGHYIDAGRKTGEIDFETIIELSEEGIKIAKKKNDLNALGVLERHIGNSYYFEGKYDKAAKSFYQSLDYLEQQNNSTELAETFNSTAKLFRKTRDLDKSAEYYEKALEIYTKLKDSVGLATIYNEYGVVHEYKNDLKTAENFYARSLAINKALKNSEGICYALNNLAGVFILQAQYKKAENYLGQALALRKILNDSLALGITYSDLGQALLAANNLVGAKRYFDSSIIIAKTLNYAELLLASNRGLAIIYEGMGDWQRAALMHKSTKVLSDSLFNLEKAKQVEELSTKYETGKKQNKILAQQLQIKQTNIYLFALVCVILLLAIWAQKRYRDIKQQKENEQKELFLLAQKEKTQAIIDAEEKERFRIGSDLHDGVGQIMSAVKMNISAYEDEVNQPQTNVKRLSSVIDMVDLACAEVRNVSHQMMPLNSFDNRLDRALKALAERIDGENLRVNLYTEGLNDNLASPTKNMLYRIIQESINNAIKHSKASTLDINVVSDDDGITATVEDNGIGFDTNDKKHRSGVGLNNIQSRLEYINGTMEINSEPGRGTCMIIYVTP